MTPERSEQDAITFELSDAEAEAIKGGMSIQLSSLIAEPVKFVACNSPFVACNAPFVACNSPFAL